ncbi:galanin receptor 2a-like [Xenia sp. Carnegie-2017]|uniref:galanin receptor 2a-like n=1 Tax=Xenia sp. Carnegie-2017 TaxID=2897299 RepID=UPI001F04954D|nr:galanin receptor 2a-like [Xenia sp. Carnegie-2017]
MAYFQGTFEKRCMTTGAPTELSFITTTFSIIFTIVNIPGNLLVIIAVVLDPYKNLRTPFNYLMANLAMADLIVGTVTDPLSVYIHLKEGIDEKLHKKEIQALHMSYFISCTASVLSLATLAIERYLAVRNPHNYRNRFTTKRVLATTAIIWLISLSLPFVYFEVGYITYAFIFANTGIVFAITITILTYSLMFRTFQQRTGNAIINNHNGNEKKSMDEITPRSDQSQTAAAWERKVTKMFLCVLVALLCCYGPSTIFIYIMSFCESCDCTTLHWFRDLQFLFVIANSSVNFFCYALRSRRFRNAFWYIFRMKRIESPEPISQSGARSTQSSNDTRI